MKKNSNYDDNNAQFQSLFNNVDDFILILDMNSNILDVNSAVLNRAGYSRSELIGNNVKMLHPPDRYQDIEETIIDIFQGKRLYCSVPILTKNKKLIPVDTCISICRWSDKDAILCISRDISDQLKVAGKLYDTEAQFQTIFTSINEGIAIHELVYDNSGKPIDYRILDVNPAYEKIVGIKKEDAIDKLASVLYGTGKPPYLEIYSKVALTGRSDTFETTFEPMDKSFKISVFSPSRGKFATLFADITERKSVEEKLKESEEKYKALFDRTQHAIYLNDLEGNFLDANDVALNLLGYEKKDIPNLNFSDLLDEEQLKLAFETTIGLFETGKIEKPTQYKLKCKAGTYIWVETEGSLVYKDGKPYAIQGIAKDITDKKLVQKALERSEEKYRELVENLDEVIYQIDLKGWIKYVSPRIRSLIGYENSELLEQDLKNFIYKDDLQRVLKNVQEIFNGKSSGDEYRIITKNGDIRWIHTSSRPIFENGKTVGLQGVLSDVTDRKLIEEALKESEEKYRNIIQQSSEGFILINERGTIIEWNRAQENITGIKSEKVLGKPFWDILVLMQFDIEDIKQQKEQMKSMMLDGLKTGKGFWMNRPFPRKIRHSNGSMKVVESLVFPINTSKGRMLGSINRDITEQKLAQEKIIENEKKFRAIFDQSSQLAVILSPEGNILDVNEKIKKLPGFKTDIIGKPYWSEEFWPDSPELQKKVHKEFLRAKKREFVKFETREIRNNILHVAENLIFPVKDEKNNIMFLVATGLEITDRILAEEAIKESEKKLRLITENTSDFITITDKTGKFIYVSPSQKRLGYDPEEFIGNYGEHLIHPEDLPKLIEELGDFYNLERIDKTVKDTINGISKPQIKDGIDSPRVIEYRVIDKLGNYHNIQATVNPVYDNKGNIDKLVHVSKDITEKKKIENALRDSEAKLRSIFESSPDAITVTDLSGEVIECNPATMNLHGFSEKNEMIGKNSFDFIAPEEQQRAYENLKKTIEDGYLKNIEYTMLRNDGTRFQAELSASPILDVNGKPTAFVGITKDITDRKRNEEELRKLSSVVNQSTNSIAILDINGNLEYANPKFYETYDVEPKRFIGQNWRSLKFDFSNFKDKSSEIATTVLKNSLVWKGEIFNKNHEGSTVWRQSTLFPLKDESNKITHIIYSGEDITERKRAEEELEFRLALERVITKISTNFINLPLKKIDTGISQALGILGKFAGVDRSYLFQFNNEYSLMSNTHEWCDEGIIPQIGDLQELSMRHFKWTINQLKKGKTIHIPKVSELPSSAAPEKEVFEQGGIRSLIMLPMEISGKVIGFIGFDSVKTEKSWSRDIISLLKTLGSMFANTLERKRVEEELRKSEERFREFFENEPEYCYMVSPDGNILNVNKAALRALGFKKDELVGKPVTSIYAPEEKEKVKSVLKKWKIKNKLNDEELMVITKIGERKTVLLSASVVKDNKGHIIHSISVQKDVTQLKIAENALKESEEKFRTLAENSPNMIFINQNRKVVYVNNKCVEVMGYKKEEFYDRKFNFMNLIAPEYKEKIAETYRIHIDNRKEVTPFEYAIVDKSGNRLEALYFSKLIKYRGENAILGTIVDISARKQAEDALRKSEDRYRTISELISDFVYSIKVSPDGTQESEWSTETLHKIIGLDHEKLLERGGWQSVICTEDLPVLMKRSQKLASGKPDIAEYRVRDKNGEIHWVRDYGYPIWDNAQGRVVRIYGAAQDITEHKQAEEEIRKSKERFQDIVNLLPEAVFELDLNGNFTYANQRAFEISGFTQKDLDSGLNAIEMFVPEDKKRVKMNITKILKGEHLGINEYTARRKDGTLYPALIHTAAIMHHGKSTGLRGIIMDISERKAAEDALKKSEEDFKLLFENAGEGIIYLDPEGEIIDINPKALEFADGKREEFIEKNILELGLNFGLDEEEMWSTFDEILADKKDIKVEWKVTNKKGEKLILLAHPSLIKIDGKLTGISVIIEDITQRKAAEEALRESEEKFRGIAEGSFDIIFILDLEGKIDYISPVVERLLGYKPELLLSKNFIEYLPSSELSKVETVQDKLMKGGGFEGLELKIQSKDGTIRYFEVNLNPIYKLNEPVGVQGIARDITERKYAEEEMKKQLMKFKLDEGEVYLVKERSPTLSLEAFKDLVKAGYSGLIISRTPEKHFSNVIDENNEFLWLSEKHNQNSIPPNLKKIEERIENLTYRKIILLDRLDYLTLKNKFKDLLSMIHHIKDLAVIHNHIVIISFDPEIINAKELRLLEKETKEIQTVYKLKLPEHFFNILRYIYQQNVMGIKPSYTDIGTELELSKPTVRKRIRELTTTGYLMEYEKGRNKVVELTSRGKNIFLK